MREGIRQNRRVNGHVCEFCRKKFTSETLLLNHLCEKKRRFLQREDKSVKLAFMAYQRFYERGMARRAHLPGLAAFEGSKLYPAFVRFARYLLDLKAIHPMGFVDFLVRIETPIDRWVHPSIYGTYIRELSKNEQPVEAIERSFMLMEHWAVESGEDWHDFFQKLSPSKAVLWIISGRISPWILFTASTASDLLARLNPEQMAMIEQAIDSEFWTAKMARHKDDVEGIRAILTEERI